MLRKTITRKCLRINSNVNRARTKYTCTNIDMNTNKLNDKKNRALGAIKFRKHSIQSNYEY